MLKLLSSLSTSIMLAYAVVLNNLALYIISGLLLIVAVAAFIIDESENEYKKLNKLIDKHRINLNI